jgi:hypothetical protein
VRYDNRDQAVADASAADQAKQFERGRRAVGEDVPPFGCPDALIGAYRDRAVAEQVDNNDADLDLARERGEREGRVAVIGLVRDMVRGRLTGDQGLKTAIHERTKMIRKAAIKARQRVI